MTKKALVLVVVAAALVPTGADARPVKSKISADVSGVINRQGTIFYFFSGNVGAQGLMFGCMEGRKVVLFRVDEGGKDRRVMSAKTGFFGVFSAPLEKSFAAIPGHYYAKVEPRIRTVKKGRLRCLTARTETFLVRVPPELLEM